MINGTVRIINQDDDDGDGIMSNGIVDASSWDQCQMSMVLFMRSE
jgi:hypothetical protein